MLPYEEEKIYWNTLAVKEEEELSYSYVVWEVSRVDCYTGEIQSSFDIWEVWGEKTKKNDDRY